jgi:hypothetical protein
MCIGAIRKKTNDDKIYQMAMTHIGIPNNSKICQHFPIQSLPKFTKDGIFGIQILIPSGTPVLHPFQVGLHASVTRLSKICELRHFAAKNSLKDEILFYLSNFTINFGKRILCLAFLFGP